MRLKSGEQAALQQICQLTALQSLQLGYSNILSSFSRYRCEAGKMLNCWCFICLGCTRILQDFRHHSGIISLVSAVLDNMLVPLKFTAVPGVDAAAAG